MDVGEPDVERRSVAGDAVVTAVVASDALVVAFGLVDAIRAQPARDGRAPAPGVDDDVAGHRAAVGEAQPDDARQGATGVQHESGGAALDDGDRGTVERPGQGPVGGVAPHAGGGDVLVARPTAVKERRRHRGGQRHLLDPGVQQACPHVGQPGGELDPGAGHEAVGVDRVRSTGARGHHVVPKQSGVLGVDDRDLPAGAFQQQGGGGADDRASEDDGVRHERTVAPNDCSRERARWMVQPGR